MRRYLAPLLALVSLAAVAADEGGWTTDFSAAKKEAAKRGVPILADFSGSDWCGWCIRLDKEVFSEADFRKFAADNFVLFLADFPNAKPQTDALKAQNAALAEKYGVQGFPTVLILDAEGKVIGKTGYRRGGAAAYIEHLKGFLGPNRG
ncbi:MAG: thioredoxin family protein [Lentisphaerae bacterium]|nr:thioredoxin family protein [Lentisphaerota bacterium]